MRLVGRWGRYQLLGWLLLLQGHHRQLLLWLLSIQFGDAVLNFLLLLVLRLPVHFLHLLHVLVHIGVARHPQHPPLNIVDVRAVLIDLRRSGRQICRVNLLLAVDVVAVVEPDGPLSHRGHFGGAALSLSLVGVVVVSEVRRDGGGDSGTRLGLQGVQH